MGVGARPAGSPGPARTNCSWTHRPAATRVTPPRCCPRAAGVDGTAPRRPASTGSHPSRSTTETSPSSPSTCAALRSEPRVHGRADARPGSCPSGISPPRARSPDTGCAFARYGLLSSIACRGALRSLAGRLDFFVSSRRGPYWDTRTIRALVAPSSLSSIALPSRHALSASCGRPIRGAVVFVQTSPAT